MKWIDYILLMVFLSLANTALLSQEVNSPLSTNSLLLKDEVVLPPNLSSRLLFFQFSPLTSSLPTLQQSMLLSPTTTLPSAYCSADLAFFCKLEVKLEKATKMPVRFRLGDVQQVDYMEGKYEGWRYGY